MSDSGKKRGSSTWLVLLLVLPLVGAVVGLLSGAVWAYVAPKKFQSIAVLQVMPEQQVVAGGVLSSAAQSESSFATQVALISSRGILDRVVERLDLVQRWNISKDEAAEVLAGIITTTRIRGTDLVEIRVRHTNPMDAKEIAETTAEEYAAYRREMATEQASKELEAHEEELRTLEDQLEEKRKVLDTIVQAIGIPDVVGVAGSGEGSRSQERIFELAERNYFELETEKKQLDGRVEKLRKLEGDDLYKFAAGLNLEENGAAVLFQQYSVEKRVLSRLIDEGLGEAHPKVIAQGARVDILEDDLQRSVASLRGILDTQSELLDLRLEKMQKVVRERRDVAVERALESHDYLEAKREYEAAQKLLQEWKLANSSRRIALKIPRHPVVLHEMPRAGRKPVSPNVPLTLAGGLAGGFVLGILFALLSGVIGWLRRQGGG